jgi:hypothetical protein
MDNIASAVGIASAALVPGLVMRPGPRMTPVLLGTCGVTGAIGTLPINEYCPDELRGVFSKKYATMVAIGCAGIFVGHIMRCAGGKLKQVMVHEMEMQRKYG